MNRHLNTTLLSFTARPAGQSCKKISERANDHENTYLDLLTIPSLWAAAGKTERRCFSKHILVSNVTRNIKRSADSFSPVPSRVNGVNWVWTVSDLEAIIVSVLLAFSIIPYRSNHILTLFKSGFIYSVIATLSPGDVTTTTKVESSAKP